MMKKELEAELKRVKKTQSKIEAELASRGQIIDNLETEHRALKIALSIESVRVNEESKAAKKLRQEAQRLDRNYQATRKVIDRVIGLITNEQFDDALMMLKLLMGNYS